MWVDKGRQAGRTCQIQDRITTKLEGHTKIQLRIATKLERTHKNTATAKMNAHTVSV